MSHKRRSAMVTVLSAVVLLSCAAGPTWADVRLPHVIGDNMVLQRGMPVPIWGWAEPGEKVTVKVAGQEKSAAACDEGMWRVTLDAIQGGGAVEMTVAGKNTITVKNILIGEVWLCSGQSNMQFGVGGSKSAKQAIPSAKFPKIRLFDVPRVPSISPQTDCKATWRECSPATVPGFTAVGFFFGRKLHKDLDVPIGLIGSSWGGTLIEPWTPPSGFAAVKSLEGIAKGIEKRDQDYRKSLIGAVDAMDAWVKSARKAIAAGKNPPHPPAMPGQRRINHQSPTALYNGMIHPVVPFAIRGAIWYQGESNMGQGMVYHEKMKALIAGWRKVFGHEDLSFYFVQLAPYARYGNGALPRIWEAQTATLAIPGTGMAVITDVGNTKDIHPRNKVDVGERLALWALAKNYGKTDLVYSGPLYKSMSVEDGKVRIKFDHVGGGLVSRDGKDLTHFQIAGADKKFLPAKAVIDGKDVVVSCDAVKKPVAVRFGFHKTAEPNLMNKEKLPASPFRTDRW